MENPTRLTDIVLITYPSNHVLKQSIKIVLLGKGREWKDELINQANEFWTESPLMFFYIDSDQYCSDSLSWLYLHIKNANFIIGNISNDIEDALLVAPFIINETTFVTYDNNVDEDFRNWLESLNPNTLHSSSMPAIILKIKEQSCKY